MLILCLALGAMVPDSCPVAKEDEMFEFTRTPEGLPVVALEQPPPELRDQGRHARLFELLRQQSLSKRVAQRIDRKAFPRVTKGDRLLLQNMASASFQMQKVG
ncbi:hypothetical protein [Tropicibacter sp. Alg240-R139]|uniref:hypothetical protein n=1 Tax=Tropicibacter sp. Alg240-R139 TaxID=2305991 RepID=UPI0013DFC0E4|nr:hypothetical protein [Tropicibacter sp. Alg240-R139]